MYITSGFSSSHSFCKDYFIILLISCTFISSRSGWVTMMSHWVASRGEEELRERLMEY